MRTAIVLPFPVVAKTDPQLPLPNRVRYWRDQRRLTLKQLAPKAGIGFGHLGKIERGLRELTMPVMERLAVALDIEVADLVNVEYGGLTERERLLIDTYRQVPEGMRAAIDAVAESQQPFRGAPEVVGLTRKAG